MSIFISYSRKDNKIMQSVKSSLNKAGFKTWTDEGIEPGTESWKAAIAEALETASSVVVLFSPTAKRSPWVNEELDYAKHQGVKIYPLLVKGNSKNSVPFGFSTAQWFDLRSDLDSGIKQLIEYLKSTQPIQQKVLPDAEAVPSTKKEGAKKPETKSEEKGTQASPKSATKRHGQAVQKASTAKKQNKNILTFIKDIPKIYLQFKKLSKIQLRRIMAVMTLVIIGFFFFWANQSYNLLDFIPDIPFLFEPTPTSKRIVVATRTSRPTAMSGPKLVNTITRTPTATRTNKLTATNASSPNIASTIYSALTATVTGEPTATKTPKP